MEENNKWRFPASNHGQARGISHGDIETFKKAPYQAFAREILQNSIDARDSDEEPVRVEFSEFEIRTKDIPGYNELRTSIGHCIEFWSDKEDYVKEYQDMDKILSEPKISCLRISDFNTTGLIGVESSITNKNQFLALTKGTGVSEKSGKGSGGSKGIGKNAAFLMSSLKLVMYSTRSEFDLHNNIGTFIGSIGVAEFVSGYLNDEIREHRDYTQGTGYFGSDDFNNPVKRIINLDTSFIDRENEYGTDIYVLGFQHEDNWEKEVINSILDSFMASIVRNQLEIKINHILITKDSVEKLIFPSQTENSYILENNKNNIISQYRLLTNKDSKVSQYDIDTEYGACSLYVLAYSKNEEDYSTNKCVMIRHPLMKIKENNIPNCRASAMCIIENGKLGQKLREIENAKHIDWEPERLKDKILREEIKNVLKDIYRQINEKIIEFLGMNNTEPLDPNGAGEFLPDSDLGDSSSKLSKNQTPDENVSISKPKENFTCEKNANESSENGQGLEPNIGSIDDQIDGDLMHPVGENTGGGGEYRPGSEPSGEKSGDSIIYKKSKLSGVKYNMIMTNKSSGLVKIIFTSPIENSSCYLKLLLKDDANFSTAIEIRGINCNGEEIISDDKFEYGPFKIYTNEKTILLVKTNQKEYFASEVKILCN